MRTVPAGVAKWPLRLLQRQRLRLLPVFLPKRLLLHTLRLGVSDISDEGVCKSDLAFAHKCIHGQNMREACVSRGSFSWLLISRLLAGIRKKDSALNAACA